MRKWTPFVWLFICGFLVACQSFKKNGDKPLDSGKIMSAPIEQSVINQIVKEQKKAQAALDIPIRTLDTSASLQKVGFASCLDQDVPAPILKPMRAENFDLLLMMGDNVYATRPESQVIADQYKKLLKIEDFAELRAHIPMMATWDDHDYGLGDGGAENPNKEMARRDFLNFWPYVKNSLSKNQQALYHSKIFGPTHRDVQIIMLDTRWDRSALIENPNKEEKRQRYIPNTDKKAHMLSETQWKWLESELRKPARLRFIVSSIQLIANAEGFEKWGQFPHERERFFELVKKTNPKNLYILSGDRHMASLAKTEIKSWGPLYDITSSSLNKSKDVVGEDPDYIEPTFSGENYGVALIDWRTNKISFQIKDNQGKAVKNLELKFK